MKAVLIFIFYCVCIPFTSSAQGYIEFTENKGQWDSDILYQGNIGGGLIAITKTGYRVLKYDAASQKLMTGHQHEADVKDKVIKGHVWNIKFLGTNVNKRTIPSKPLEGVSNYYIGNDPTKWATLCKTYTNIKIENIYENIDILYYTSNRTLKYDIIVRPGGNPNNIKLQYNDVEKISKGKNGELIVQTSIGDFKELNPYTYQIVDNQKQVVNSGYTIKGNELTYALANYDTKSTLIIDPTLIFSTHSGSTADNWGFTATYGPDETFYGGGDVRGNGFPVTSGVFQGTYGGPSGGTDVAIIKLNQTGNTRLYATYLGGNNLEQPHSLICDALGNLIIAGRTNSTNFPTTVTFGSLGGYDIFVTKLNPNGTALIGSIKIGGSSDDGVNIDAARTGRSSLQYNYGDDGRSEVNLDNQGNIILASCTRSNNFYTTPTALQTTFGGSQDAVLLKANSTLSSLIFSSYFGGSGDDAAYVVNVNPEDGNIYYAGGTASLTLTGTGGTVIQNVNSGNVDGFVTIINPAGTSVIKTTFIGTAAHDQIYGIQFDKFNFPYIMGISLGNMTPINATFSQSGSHQFIAKLEKDLSNYVYRTTFGTNTALTNISPVAFLVDKCQNVYVSGWGGTVSAGYSSAGTTGMSITADALQTNTDGKDFYYFVLERNATSQLFGSYFGGNQGTGSNPVGEHVDGGTSRFDPKGYIYQAACASCDNVTGNASYPVNPSGLQQDAAGTGCNLGMTKIRFNLNGVGADLKVDDTVGCVPFTTTFRDDFLNAVSYEYNFADGTGTFPTTATSMTHTFTTPGFYRVRMIAIDLASCNLRDTSYKTIRVRGDSAILGFNGIKQPPCLNLSYQFNNLSIAPAGKPFSNNSFSWDFGDGTGIPNAGTAAQLKTYAGAGTYSVKLILKDTNYCNAPDSIVQVFRLSPTVKADFDVVNGCAPFTTTFTNKSLAGTDFQWTFSDVGATSTAVNPTYTFNNAGTYTITLVANDPNTCNFTDTMRKTITINPTPVADFSFLPIPPQINTPTQFNNLSTNATIYKWVFGDGDSSTLSNPLHQFLRTATFNTCLYASNQFGCRDTVCKDVPAIVEPLIDIPNALTPNGDGVNDLVIPRGFGIQKIIFRIFNRWGNLIFETNTRNTGWDGKYKGVVQAMDAYSYTLDAEMVDGKKVKQSGNITLLR